MAEKLVYSGLTDKYNGTAFQLEIFKESGLIPTSLIPLTPLEQAFRCNIMNISIEMFYWEDDKVYKKRDQAFSLKTLLKDCAEVREFARLHFPQFTV